MQRNVFLGLLVVLAAAFTLAPAASIFDILNWDIEKGEEGEDSSGAGAEQRDENVKSEGESTCSCDGPTCMCCVDFNMTIVDLGGPGCVNMKYLSQDEGLMVNVSYGESLLHSEQVKGPDPKPTCMSLLAKFAEVCARFSSLEPHNDGLKGCLQLEPKLLGDIQTQFNIGCFTMGPDGMRLHEEAATGAETIDNGVNKANATETEESEELSEEELFAAVNESAQQGLAFFGNLLGLAFSNQETNKTDTSETETETETETEAETTENPDSQSARKARLLPTKVNQV